MEPLAITTFVHTREALTQCTNLGMWLAIDQGVGVQSAYNSLHADHLQTQCAPLKGSSQFWKALLRRKAASLSRSLQTIFGLQNPPRFGLCRVCSGRAVSYTHLRAHE